MRKEGPDEKTSQRVPLIGMEYGFLGKDGEAVNPTLIARDARTGATYATWVPGKGASDEWVVKRILIRIDGLVYTEVIVKSDQEASILAVQESIKSRRQHSTILENSPVGE